MRVIFVPDVSCAPRLHRSSLELEGHAESQVLCLPRGGRDEKESKENCEEAAGMKTPGLRAARSKPVSSGTVFHDAAEPLLYALGPAILQSTLDVMPDFSQTLHRSAVSAVRVGHREHFTQRATCWHQQRGLSGPKLQNNSEHTWRA